MFFSNVGCLERDLRYVWQEDPTLAIFEDVDGGADRVCRGKHSGPVMRGISWWRVCVCVSLAPPRRQLCLVLHSEPG